MRREHIKKTDIQFVSWIQPDGNCLIHTGLYNTPDTITLETEFKIYYVQKVAMIICSNTYYGLQIYTTNNGYVANQGYGVNASGVQEFETYTDATTRKIRRKESAPWWGVQEFSRSITDGQEVQLMGVQSLPSYGSISKFYYVNIKRNGVYVRKYLPCIQNGIIGLYDTLNNNFVTSDTGTFTYGL